MGPPAGAAWTSAAQQSLHACSVQEKAASTQHASADENKPVVGQPDASAALGFPLEANSTAPNSYSEASPPLTPGQSSPTQKCQPVLLAWRGAPAPQDSALTLRLPKSPHLRPSQLHGVCATMPWPLLLFVSQSVGPWSICPDRQVPVPPSLARLQHCTRLLNHAEHT